jgi:hypothetical protein
MPLFYNPTPCSTDSTDQFLQDDAEPLDKIIFLATSQRTKWHLQTLPTPQSFLDRIPEPIISSSHASSSALRRR